jgi:hypothetical protein
MSLNNNKPVLQCAKTLEIPFSRPIAKGISSSGVSFGQLLQWSVRKAEFFFASNTSSVITQHVIKQQ